MSKAKPTPSKRGFFKKLPNGQWISINASPYRPFWLILETMPPLSHWADRSKPFDYAHSDVIRFIMSRCNIPLETAIQVWNSARYKHVIKFDPESRLWSGVEGGSQ
jgi:hypothetical protein